MGAIYCVDLLLRSFYWPRAAVCKSIWPPRTEADASSSIHNHHHNQLFAEESPWILLCAHCRRRRNKTITDSDWCMLQWTAIDFYNRITTGHHHYWFFHYISFLSSSAQRLYPADWIYWSKRCLLLRLFISRSVADLGNCESMKMTACLPAREGGRERSRGWLQAVLNGINI